MQIEFWLRVLILLTCWIVAYRFASFASQEKSWIMGCYAVTALTVGIYHGAEILIQDYNISGYRILLNAISGWSPFIAISFLYCGLAHLIRDNKPKVARFPIIFTALPLLIIFSYPFASETEVIDQWLLQIYEAGALLISFLVYGYQGLEFKLSYYYKVLAGIGLLFLSYVFYWLLLDYQWINSWSWQFTFIAGIILFYKGYRDAVMKDFSR